MFSSYGRWHDTDFLFTEGLEIAELKAAALEHIRCSLTPENVVTEICSPFTARFPEVKKIEREYLKANWVRFHAALEDTGTESLYVGFVGEREEYQVIRKVDLQSLWR